MTKKYWCPTCDEVTATDFLGIADMMQHRGGCRAKFIPVVEPLDVPEVTTWGESGGAEAVCLRAYFDDVVHIRGRRFTFPGTFGISVSDGTSAHIVPDIVTAINYLEKKS